MLQLFPGKVLVKIEGVSVPCTKKGEVELVKEIEPLKNCPIMNK